MTQATEQTLVRIAGDVLSLDTLETRGSDRLDFHDLAVWAIKDALAAAYQAGVDAATARAKTTAPQPASAPWPTAPAVKFVIYRGKKHEVAYDRMFDDSALYALKSTNLGGSLFPARKAECRPAKQRKAAKA